ncbi:hypothetical protein ACFE04_025188 [Oxalis oulophora]
MGFESLVSINLDRGDPTMYDSYWRQHGDKCRMEISSQDSMSYFSNNRDICWFMEPALADAIKRLHKVVGNAVTEDRYLVVGTGSTTLYQALLYALSCDEKDTVSVVCPAPFYSSYKELTQILRSRLYEWEGDAYSFDKEGPYVELVISPNNPDGVLRHPVVDGCDGKLIHDLAYYWPQYTPITKAADFDNMLFTLSKCSGHAGSRIGWAIVKDKEVAEKMIKFITVSSIGVSRESQLRAAKILDMINEECLESPLENFFEQARLRMCERWARLRNVLKTGDVFSIPKYPEEYCKFVGTVLGPNPAYAWLKHKEEIDTEILFRKHNVAIRGGKTFGVEPKYGRVSLLCDDQTFDIFLDQLSTIIKGV